MVRFIQNQVKLLDFIMKTYFECSAFQTSILNICVNFPFFLSFFQNIFPLFPKWSCNQQSFVINAVKLVYIMNRFKSKSGQVFSYFQNGNAMTQQPITSRDLCQFYQHKAFFTPLFDISLSLVIFMSLIFKMIMP